MSEDIVPDQGASPFIQQAPSSSVPPPSLTPEEVFHQLIQRNDFLQNKLQEQEQVMNRQYQLL